MIWNCFLAGSCLTGTIVAVLAGERANELREPVGYVLFLLLATLNGVCFVYNLSKVLGVE